MHHAGEKYAYIVDQVKGQMLADALQPAGMFDLLEGAPEFRPLERFQRVIWKEAGNKQLSEAQRQELGKAEYDQLPRENRARTEEALVQLQSEEARKLAEFQERAEREQERRASEDLLAREGE
ncbi:hypothetical protein HDV00_011277, partial [Rhizophlyctis rosea]